MFIHLVSISYTTDVHSIFSVCVYHRSFRNLNPAFVGIILYELLTVIPEEDWTKRILSTREGGYLQDKNLLENEKSLLGALLVSDAAYRPSDVQDVIDVVEILRDNYNG